MANNVNISLLLRTRGFTKGLANAKRKLTTFGQVSQTVGRTMQYALGGALIAVGADAAKAAADFDLASRKLKALSGPEAAAGVEGLSNQARQLGKSSIFTASEVANLQVEMKKLGLTTKDVSELSDVTVRFATAMDTDAANAGAVLVKTLNKFKSSFDQYGNKADAATKLSDQMAHAVLNSALTFDTLQASLGYAGGEAEAAGFSFSDTTAILAELANAGFEGSRAGTILRRIFINLAKTGTTDLKKSFGDLIENQQEFADLIKITGARSAGGIASIQGLRAAIEEFAKANENASGEVEGLYDAVDQSLIGRVKNLRSAFQELGIVFEKQFGRQLREVITSLAEFVRGISASDARAAGAVTGFLLITKVLKGMRIVIGNLALAFVGKGGVAGLAKIFLRFNPVGVIVTAFLAGMAIMRSSMNKLKNKAVETKQKIEDMATAFGSVGGADDVFLNKVADKGFDSQAEFLKEANERQSNLAVALQRGRQGVQEARAAAGITEKLAEQGERLLRQGYSVGDVLNGFIAQQSDGLISGMNKGKLQKDEDNYKAFLNSIKETMYNEAELVRTRELIMNSGQSKSTTYWDTAIPTPEVTKEIEDLIEKFEDAQQRIFGDNEGEGSLVKNMEEYAEALRILQKEEERLAYVKAEVEGRGGKASEGLEEDIKNNKTLQNFYKANETFLQDAYDLELKMAAAREKGVNTMGFTTKQMKDQLELSKKLALQRRQEQSDYLAMGEGMQGIVDRLRDAGYTMRESLTGAQTVLVDIFDSLMSAVDGLAQAFARGVVDPSVSMADAMKDWASSLLQGIITAIAKVAILTAAIAVGNALTGGGVTALLKLMAGSGQAIGGAATMANTFAGGGSLGGGTRSSFTGYVAGSDLVLTTSRGINANDRLYG